VGDFVECDPKLLAPGELYDLLHEAIQPRPVVLVSTLHPDGSPNLAPFSYITVGGIHPPSLVFSPTLSQKSTPKNSLRNVERSGEFVVNIVDDRLADALTVLGAERQAPFNEFAAAGLTMAPSQKVQPPRIAESPLQLECRVFQIVAHGEGPGSANYVIGEVLQIHRRVEVHPVGRLSGADYLDTKSMEIFRLPRHNL